MVKLFFFAQEYLIGKLFFHAAYFVQIQKEYSILL